MPLKTLLEAGLWIGFAIIAYIYSFEFDQNIQGYRFDATGWPRMVIIFIVLAALAHVYQVYRDGALRGPVGSDVPGQETAAPKTHGQRLSLIAMLALPLIYAWLLEPIGFYALTPVFVFLLLMLAEERRWPYLIGISLGLTALLVFIFGKLLYLSLPLGNVQIFYNFSNWLLTIIR